MSRRHLLAAAALAALAAPAGARAPGPQLRDASCSVPGGPPIRIQVLGLKDRIGRLKVELWPATEADFLKDDRDLAKAGKFFARVWSDTPASGPVTLCVRTLRAGRYAMVVTHDRDGRNKFNLWRDGAGSVSDRPLGRGQPRLAHAALDVGPGGATVNVRLQYLRGLSGFSPLGT
ncbi:MAG: DUF2141 domain-containing protein [Sphingomonas sp.]